MITAEADVLRDEGEAYAAKLRAAGVGVTAVRYAGTIHDFVLLDPLRDTAAARAARERPARAAALDGSPWWRAVGPASHPARRERRRRRAGGSPRAGLDARERALRAELSQTRRELRAAIVDAVDRAGVPLARLAGAINRDRAQVTRWRDQARGDD